MFRNLLIAPIRWYQQRISPGLPRRCKYYPTCSQYASDAIKIHGVFKGTLLSSWRILRCNPWSKGGVDHVPQRGAWPTQPLGLTELLEQRKREEQAQSREERDNGSTEDSVDN